MTHTPHTNPRHLGALSDEDAYDVLEEIRTRHDTPALSVQTIHPVTTGGHNPLRPWSLAEVIGQERVKALLRRIIDAALRTERPLDHMLLVGAAGTGKTTLGLVVAHELHSEVYQLEAPVASEQLLELRGTMQPRDVLVIDEALALDTPLPTPAGWTTVGAVRPGDQLLGTNGHPVSVRRLTPIVEAHNCYRVTFGDGSSITTDAGHKWRAAPQVRSGTRYLTSRVVTTEEIACSMRPWHIDPPAPIDLPTADLRMDPYLLGQWLGNGNQGQIYISVRHEIAEGLLALARAHYPEARLLDAHVSRGSLRRLSLGRSTGGGRGGVEPSLARQHLETLGIFSTKAIPSQYLRGSHEQRLALVQGLMDSDGYISPNGHATFVNTNPSILTGFAELLRTLGYACAGPWPMADTKLTRRPCYRVTFQADPAVNPFRLRDVHLVQPRRQRSPLRRIVEAAQVASVPVRCIEVDAEDHLFLAGPHMTPTHNCHRQVVPDRRGIGSTGGAEALYHLLEDRTLVTSYGVLDFPAITVVACTTDAGLLPPSFLDRFPLQPRLEAYTVQDMMTMARWNAESLHLGIDPVAALTFAQASRGIPRIVNRYIRNAQSLIIDEFIDRHTAQEVVMVLNSTTLDGLDLDMQGALKFIYRHGRRERADGTVVYQASVNALATALGRNRDSKYVALAVEPTLIERGLLTVQSRGRELTPEGIIRAKELLK